MSVDAVTVSRAVAFADVAESLVEAGDDAVARAGAALRRLDLDDVPAGTPTARVVVAGTSTLGPIRAPLQGALAARGVAATVELGDYGRIVPELLDPQSPLGNADTTIVVLLPDGSSVFERVAIPFTAESAEEAVNGFVDELLAAIQVFRSHSSTPIVLPTLLLPPERSSMLLDLPARTRLAAAWARANQRLLEAGAEISGVVAVDMYQLAAFAPAAATDPRIAAYARSRFTDPLLLSYSREIAALVAAQLGRTSKCLVLDLDGTTWGGVLADAGPLGVISGDGRAGEAFADFQDTARQLSSQGVLLAIASKNDDELVRQALTEHSGVRLGIDDFAVIVANWDPKPGNVAGIAQALNIGVDSLVFVDDNASERGSVRAAHPQARTVAADPDDPARTVPALLRDGFFTTLRLTEDDRARPQRYRAEAERVSFRQTVDAVEDYLAGLQTEVTIAAADGTDVDRLSQLTLRTNQYNLTTLRLDPAAVQAFLGRPEAIVKTIRCADRFGDHGLVGALFAEIHDGRLDIVNFAMSCRVLGRGVESAALHTVLAEGVRRGARVASGTFIRTAKNGRAADFFRSSDFAVTGADETQEVGGHTTYLRDLATLPGPLPHLTVTVLRPEEEKP
ncbi:HAD-IIIC family phosphatase [Mycobacteroides abscessus]|uniref:HAD-IIIC family phosphatase n=1 Tax=Mycobacteroides abscessus TaxID=36809 RepID=UPI000C26B6B1|nr:HAD-IIIC family phosphatase [Mycobacteroides abscessus]